MHARRVQQALRRGLPAQPRAAHRTLAIIQAYRRPSLQALMHDLEPHHSAIQFSSSNCVVAPSTSRLQAQRKDLVYDLEAIMVHKGGSAMQGHYGARASHTGCGHPHALWRRPTRTCTLCALQPAARLSSCRTLCF